MFTRVETLELISKKKMCVSGQWKVNFEPKPKKGMFTKLDGSMVNVPILFHENYMTVVAFMPHLKAQVGTNTQSKQNKTKLHAHLGGKHSHRLVNWHRYTG